MLCAFESALVVDDFRCLALDFGATRCHRTIMNDKLSGRPDQQLPSEVSLMQKCWIDLMLWGGLKLPSCTKLVSPLGRGKSLVGLGRRPAEGCSGGLTGGPRGAFLGDGTDLTTYRHLFNVNLLYIMIM